MIFSLLIVFVKILAADQFAAKFELPLQNMKKCLGSVVQGETASSLVIEEVREAKMEGSRTENSISILAIMVFLLLQEASTEKSCYLFPASSAVHAYAASSIRVNERFFYLFSRKKLSPAI